MPVVALILVVLMTNHRLQQSEFSSCLLRKGSSIRQAGLSSKTMCPMSVTNAGGGALPGSRKLLQPTAGDGAVANALERTGLANAAQQAPGATVILPALGITPDPTVGTAAAGDGTAARGSTAAQPNAHTASTDTWAAR